jgi:hypothetical protein
MRNPFGFRVTGFAVAALCAVAVLALLLPALPAAAQDEEPAAMEHGQMDHGQMGEMGHGEMGDMSPEAAAMMDAMMKAMTPGEPHAKLAEMAGDWKLTVTSWMDPSQPPMVAEATAHREMTLGGRVLHEAVEGTMMGMPFEGEGETGYDNVTGEYWSTWMDSMSTGITLSTGNWDEETGAMVMYADAVDPVSHEKKKTRMVSRTEDGKEVFTMYDVTGGQEVKLMQIVYERAGGM